MSLIRHSLPIVTRITTTRIAPITQVRYKSTTESVVDTVKKTATNLAETAQSTLHSAKQTLNKATNRASESMSSTYNDMNSENQSVVGKVGNKMSEVGQKMKHRAQEAGMMAEDNADEAAFKAKNRFTKSNASDSWQASGLMKDQDNDFAHSNTDADADTLTQKMSRVASDAAASVSSMAHDAKEKLHANSNDDGDWSERASKMADTVEKEAELKSKQWDSQSNKYN